MVANAAAVHLMSPCVLARMGLRTYLCKCVGGKGIQSHMLVANHDVAGVVGKVLC